MNEQEQRLSLFAESFGPPSEATRRSASRSIAIGVGWALLTVAVWAAWPAFTRLSVTSHLNPEDLVLLRYGLGGLLLLPVLLRNASRMTPGGWREGIWLATFQGAPLALIAIS